MASGRTKESFDPKTNELEEAALKKFRNQIEEQLYSGIDPGVVAKRISALANTLVRSETVWKIKREILPK